MLDVDEENVFRLLAPQGDDEIRSSGKDGRSFVFEKQRGGFLQRSGFRVSERSDPLHVKLLAASGDLAWGHRDEEGKRGAGRGDSRPLRETIRPLPFGYTD